RGRPRRLRELPARKRRPLPRRRARRAASPRRGGARRTRPRAAACGRAVVLRGPQPQRDRAAARRAPRHREVPDPAGPDPIERRTALAVRTGGARMKCDQLEELILFHAGGAAESEESRAVLEHLSSGCPRCAGRLAEAEAALAGLPLAIG